MKNTIRFTMLAIGGLFILGCALFSNLNPMTELPASDPISEETTNPTTLENENLLAGIPAGFMIAYEAEQNNQSIREMVAEGESVDKWSVMVTAQIFLGEGGVIPAQYQATLTDAWFNACAGSESYPVAEGVENGYNFVLWQLYCPLNPATQLVEFAYIKAIQGNDSFYLVQVAFRHQPSDEEITHWMGYLKQVQVCDSRIPEQTCP